VNGCSKDKDRSDLKIGEEGLVKKKAPPPVILEKDISDSMIL